MADAGAVGDRKLKVFISYSRKDEDFAQELLGGLEMASSPISISTTSLPVRIGRRGSDG
jgi:hypothetical protein